MKERPPASPAREGSAAFTAAVPAGPKIRPQPTPMSTMGGTTPP